MPLEQRFGLFQRLEIDPKEFYAAGREMQEDLIKKKIANDIRP